MNTSKRKPIALKILLLLVVCIGAMQLVFCRYAEPALYEKITAPVIRFTHAAFLQVGKWCNSLAAAMEPDETQPPVEEPQVAGGPAIVDDRFIADPTLTEFVSAESGEILTGGNVPIVYYNQADEAWASLPFGKDPIGKYGCGPTTLSMAISSCTDQGANPAEMAAWAADSGYWAPRSGSYLSIIPGAAREFGLNCRSLQNCTAEELTQDLAAGGGVVVALMGPGHFTKSGHFILLHGVTLDGKILVADPNSRANSLTPWDPQIILDELSTSTSSGAPLWLLTSAPSL